MMEIFVSLVNADKLGGWVRAGVASLFGYLAAKTGGALVPFLTPEMQAAVGVVASTIAVGAWQHIVKK